MCKQRLTVGLFAPNDFFDLRELLDFKKRTTDDNDDLVHTDFEYGDNSI